MLPIWRNRPLLITIIVMIVLVVLLIITAGDNNMTGAESIVGSVLAPVQGWLRDATGAIAGFFTDIFTPNEAAQENIRLKERIAELESELKSHEEIKSENERLAKLLNFQKENTQFEMITASIVGKNPGRWFDSFTINAGLNRGIKKDMAVVTGEGLAGRVTETGANWSKVMAIIDCDSSVSGIIERTRDNGIVKGQTTMDGTEPLMGMSYLPIDADLTPGDRVLTSGLGDIFPKGLIIGEVVEVTRGTVGSEKQAAVKPAVDFMHLEEVMVIVAEDGGG